MVATTLQSDGQVTGRAERADSASTFHALVLQLALPIIVVASERSTGKGARRGVEWSLLVMITTVLVLAIMSLLSLVSFCIYLELTAEGNFSALPPAPLLARSTPLFTPLSTYVKPDTPTH